MDAYIPRSSAPYGIDPAGGQSSATSTTPQVLPPQNGITVNLPLKGVNPYIADVTRTSQAQLGMIDWNPSARPRTDLGPIAYNYSYGSDGSRTAMTGFNQVMWDMIQHIDPLIEKKLLKNPRFWHDRIPRGQFQLNNGAVQQSRIFRGGLQKYAGLDEWEPIDPMPSLTNDPCSFPKHDTYTYGWDQLAWSGMRAAWGSDTICSNAFRYIKDAAQQLALILEVGMERGVQMQETFNRDTYLSKATDFGRSYVMSQKFRGTAANASPRYFYDPFVKFGDTGSSASHTADKSLVSKAFIVVDASEEVEPINWDVLDTVHELLKLRCPDACLGYDAGEPLFGLMCNAEDIDKSVEGDPKVYREWREAKPLALIQKYNLSPKVYRRWAIVSDANQIRFKIKRWVEHYNSENYGGVAKELDNSAVFIAEAVDPFIADPDHKGINGGPLPIENYDYIEAELAICPVFMNDVLTNLFETGGVSLGSGTHFGAYPSMNGQWGWVLNPQSDRDPFQQNGKFYGLFAIHQKPEARVRDVISFLYRRCKESLRAKCPMESKYVNPDYSVKNATVNKTNANINLTISSGQTVADATLVAGTPFEVILDKGYGPMYIGEDRVLKVGTGATAESVNVKVVDVTSMPYVTVVSTTDIKGNDESSGEDGTLELQDLFTVTVSGTTVNLAGKAITASLNPLTTAE